MLQKATEVQRQLSMENIRTVGKKTLLCDESQQAHKQTNKLINKCWAEEEAAVFDLPS